MRWIITLLLLASTPVLAETETETRGRFLSDFNSCSEEALERFVFALAKANIAIEQADRKLFSEAVNEMAIEQTLLTRRIDACMRQRGWES